MSMPSFPPNGADMTQEEALTMIIASIAMEELALIFSTLRVRNYNISWGLCPAQAPVPVPMTCWPSTKASPPLLRQ
mgnify:CR=1 FL=1